MLTQVSIDELFDLDLALIARAGSSNTAAVQPAGDVVVDMATVVGGDGDCTICMEELESDERAKQAPCGHVFHSKCISRWLSLHNSCPLCRLTIPPAAAAVAAIATKPLV